MTRVAVFALIVLAASPAFAQDFARPGFAVGGGFSYAGEDFDLDGLDFDDTGAIDLFGSYRFLPNLGVEGRFEQTFDFDGDGGGFDAEVDIWSLTANLQIFILTGQFQPYVGVGIGIGEAEIDIDTPFGSDSDSETDGIWRLSAGLDSYITPKFAIGGEFAYNFGIDDLDDVDYWTLSALLRYRF